MRPVFPLPLTTTLTLAFATAVAAEPLPTPAWGALAPLSGEPGAHVSDVPSHDEATRLMLPIPFPNVVKATLAGEPVPLQFNKDATEIALAIPAKLSGQLRLEIAEKTIQHSDGRIAFSALDAKVVGGKAKLETHPGNHRIGFWSDPADSVKWDYNASRPGMYEVAITYSLASGKSRVEVDYGGGKVEVDLTATGSWYHYTTVDAGRLYLEKDRKQTLTVKPISKSGGAVMNLKAVLLTPAPEGDPIIQDGDTITLRSKDATTHGVKMRYEPNPKKNCLGYWANPADWASWDFNAKTPGRYNLVVTQGCGKGHGGSVVKVLLGDQALEFTVADTGGFQNWKELDIGTVNIPAAGQHRLEVRPKKKTGVAVMDIRQIRLDKE